VKIRDLKPGDTAFVRGYIKPDKKYLSKLMAMGVTRNQKFTFIQKAPLGDPVQIEIRGFRLSLRKDEADIIVIGDINE
jgi:ferrous iron transport protein A